MGNRPSMPGSNLYGPSENIWGNVPVDQILSGDRSCGFGMQDDFTRFAATSLYDGYIILNEHTGTLVQIASEANHPGIIQFATPADNDEVTLQLGNGLDVGPYRMAEHGLAWEAYLRVDAEAITAGDHGYFWGMATGGASGCAISEQLFDADAIYATADLVGFQHLKAESTALDAMYQASGETKTDGAVNTDLDTVETLVAATWVKVGFLYVPHPRRLTWFVDGEEVAHVGESDIVEDEFPDATSAFLQPTIGMRGADATAATMDMDWLRVMQITCW